MTVCKFYQQGNCRFGNNCKFEHPGSARDGGGPFNNNRFGTLSNAPNNRGPQGRNDNRQNQNYGPRVPNNKYPGVDADTIKLELTEEKPVWPFSCYSPGRNAPRQLFEGAIEQSPEEMRCQFYLAQSRGNIQAAQQAEIEIVQKVNAQVEQALRDLNGAVKYILDGDNQHPNRIDQCLTNQQQQPNSWLQQPSTPFGGASPNTRPAFGQPSFGQPSTPQTGFGQPSALGQAGAFGRPSPLGQTSTFGQPSAPGTTSPFARPSGAAPAGAFGQPSFGQPSTPNQPSAFGQSSRPGVTLSPFGQPAFGQPSAPAQTGGFGKPSFGTPATPFAAQTGATFGQPSQPVQSSPFANIAATQKNANASPFSQQPTQSPFSNAGQGNTNSMAASPFGQPNQNATASPFGQPVAPASTFGQPSKPPASPFGQQAAAPSPFAGQTQAQNAASPFGQPATNGATGANPFGPALAASQPFQNQQQQQQPETGINGVASNGAPSIPATTTANIVRDPRTNNITSFNGCPVQYIDQIPCYLPNPRDRNSLERIWFPDGPPPPNPYTESQPPTIYEGEKGPKIANAYKFALENGTWQGGKMPEVAPRWDMNVWAI